MPCARPSRSSTERPARSGSRCERVLSGSALRVSAAPLELVSALDPVQRDRTPRFGPVLPGEGAGVEVTTRGPSSECSRASPCGRYVDEPGDEREPGCCKQWEDEARLEEQCSGPRPTAQRP